MTLWFGINGFTLSFTDGVKSLDLSVPHISNLLFLFLLIIIIIIIYSSYTSSFTYIEYHI